MAARDPETRSASASIAALTGWAFCEDRTARTASARRAFIDKFERLVDPDGVLNPVERAKRAESLRKAHYKRMALASAKSRARNAARRGNVAEQDDAA